MSEKNLPICIKIHNNSRDNSPHFPLLPIPDSRFPTPDSLGARLLGRVNRPWVAPLPTPDSQIRCI
ncbi:hypothetical protein [Moorena sp. SIO2C4]|uniref:hypothetical protein n=1 Tax=Moorena sp. SIO2C4 TaxID=2607824 RepID=UPI0013CBD21D|nr:hypothetical protein [Moorena sp. SIO2C4]NES42038.1 hypothetical protein [Moorena sp. SIO2C4]